MDTYKVCVRPDSIGVGRTVTLGNIASFNSHLLLNPSMQSLHES